MKSALDNLDSAEGIKTTILANNRLLEIAEKQVSKSPKLAKTLIEKVRETQSLESERKTAEPKQYTCDYCGKGFDSLHGLKVHMGRMHGGMSDTTEETEQVLPDRLEKL